MKLASKFDSLGLKGNALVVSLTEFIHDSGIWLTDPFWSLYVLSLGGSLSDLALLFIIRGLSSVISSPLLGSLSDKIGRKKPIVIGGLIVAIGPILNAFATNWIWLIPGEILRTADFPGLWSIRQALFTDSIEQDKRGIGWASFFTIMQGASIFMPAIGGILVDTEGVIIGMRIGLIYAAVARIIQSLLNAKFLTENIELAQEKEPNKLKNGAKRIDLKNLIKNFFQPIITNKALQIVLVGSAAVYFSMGLLQRFVVVYAVDIIGITATEWGIIQSANGLINLLTRIPFGRFADKYGRRKFILIGYFGRPIFYAFFVFSNTFPQVFFSQSLYTVSMNINMPAWQALIADIVPANERTRYYASQNMIGTLLSSFSPALGALLWENYGPVWPFYTVILILMNTSFFLYLFLKEPKIREK